MNELLSLASMDYKLLPFFKGFLEVHWFKRMMRVPVTFAL